MQRGIKTYTTPRAAATACILYIALLGLTACGLPKPTGTCLFTLTVAPVYLLITAFVAGFLPMLACAAATLVPLALQGGGWLLLCGGVFLLPMAAALTYCVARRRPFRHTVLAVGMLMACAQMLIYLVLRHRLGVAPEVVLGNAVAVTILDHPYRDAILFDLLNYGLLKIPMAMQGTAIVTVPGGYAFTSELVSELLLQLRDLVIQGVQSILPVLVAGSFQNALLGISLGIYYGKRRAQRRAYKRNEQPLPVPDLGMPPLREWHLPRPWGLRIGLMACGYLIARSGAGDAAYYLGSLLWQAFTLCFSIQGLAALNAAQHRRGTSRSWRVAAVVLALVFRFMRTPLVILGVVDQFTNTRGLRPPLAPRSEEE